MGHREETHYATSSVTLRPTEQKCSGAPLLQHIAFVTSVVGDSLTETLRVSSLVAGRQRMNVTVRNCERIRHRI